MKTKLTTSLSVFVYLSGIFILGYFVIRLNFFLPEPGSYSYDIVNDLRIGCLQAANPGLSYEPDPMDYLLPDPYGLAPPRPECLLKIAGHFFFRNDVFWDTSQVYAIQANEAWSQSDRLSAVGLALKSHYYNFHYLVIEYEPFVLLSLWAVIGLYLLTYDHIPDLFERVLEGLGVGVIASSWRYYAVLFNWQYFGLEIGLPVLLLLGFIAAFVSIDLRKKQYDNLFVKLALFFMAILLLAIVRRTVFEEIYFAVVPLITAFLAVFYHYWRRLKSTRVKVGSLAYLIAFLGLLAAVAKHQAGLLSSEEIDMPEFFLDFVILLLGVLLTYLQLSIDEGIQARVQEKNENGGMSAAPKGFHSNVDHGSTSALPFRFVFHVFQISLLIGIVAYWVKNRTRRNIPHS